MAMVQTPPALRKSNRTFRAQAIVAYREKNGAFRSADELRKIKGIGAKVLERNRANIKVDGKAEGTPRKKVE